MLPAPAKPLRVLLADDHLVVLHGLKAILLHDGFDVVGEASDGRTAVSLAHTLRPDVAVLDITMPLLNGIDAAREIARTAPAVKTILLTMHAEEFHVRAALQAGVAGYLLKTGSAAEVKRAIEAVARGETYLSGAVSGPIVSAYLKHAASPPDPLSGREREVLQLIAEGKNMKEIGSLLGISARTAETHRARIMGKLNIGDVAGLVRYAISHGLTGV